MRRGGKICQYIRKGSEAQDEGGKLPRVSTLTSRVKGGKGRYGKERGGRKQEKKKDGHRASSVGWTRKTKKKRVASLPLEERRVRRVTRGGGSREHTGKTG